MGILKRGRLLSLWPVTPGLVTSGLEGCQADSPSVETAAPTADRPPLLTAQESTPIDDLSSQARTDSLPPSPLAVRGDLMIAGSNAMAPLVEAIAERFIDEGFSGSLTLERIGSREGFEVFCEKGADIVIASRPISAEERQACAAAGQRPVALAVGTDALAIVVSEDNRFLTEVTRSELAKIFTAEYWSDVRPDWPEELIRRTLPGPGSGAFRLLVDQVFKGNLESLLQATNSDFSSEDEDYLMQTLAIDPYAIALFSYAYYQGNRGTLRLITVDGASPTNREQYPLLRTLFLYADADALGEAPQVSAFLSFFLTHVNEAISQLGYFSLPQTELNKSKTALRALLNNRISEELLD